MNTNQIHNHVRHADEPDTDEAISAPQLQPVRVQMLGGSGVGKTCFLAGLALLNKDSAEHPFVVPLDAKSTSICTELRSTLAAGKWPAKTSIVDEAKFAIQNGGQRVDIVLTDYAGESFTDSMTRGSENAAAAQIQDLVRQSDVLLVLLDGSGVDANEDFDGAPLIKSVFERLENQGTSEMEVVIILTKSDLCVQTPISNGDDLKALVSQRVPDLERYLREQSIRTHWIPLTVCGNAGIDATGFPIAGQLSPDGYEAIFATLFARRKRPTKRKIGIVMSCLGLIALLAIGWIGLREAEVESQFNRFNDPNNPIVENAETVYPENESALRNRYRDDFGKATAEIDSSGSVEAVRLVLQRYRDISPEHRKLVAAELEELARHANKREEELLFQQFVDCKALKGTGYKPIIEKYLSNFPDGAHAAVVRKELKKREEAEYLTARGHIKRTSSSSPKGLKQRADAITRLLSDHGDWIDDEEKVRITRARDWAYRLLEPGQYHCTLVRSSGMDTPRDHGVEVFVAGERQVLCNDSGDVTEKTWDRDFTIRWQAGQQISFKLVNYDLRDQDMAYFINDSPVAIVLLTGQNAPTRYATTAKWGGTDFTASEPRFRVEFKCQEISDKLVPIISDYLVPGDKW